MIKVLVGARGTGKSSLLKRYQFYVGDADVNFFDLDQQIEQNTGTTILEIFSSQGEEAFRRLEQQEFQNIMQLNSRGLTVIAVGAGFDLRQLPQQAEVIWVTRDSDNFGRIFLDRPRLDRTLDPMQEYLQKWDQRKMAYQNFATKSYIVPEGLQSPSLIEKQILLGESSGLGGICTALPTATFDLQYSCEWILKMQRQGVQFVELRDDLFHPPQIEQILLQVDTQRILYSIRKSISVAESLELIGRYNLVWDWAMELGQPPIENVSIISNHLASTISEVEEQTGKYEKNGAHIKWAPEIKTWKELFAALDWQQNNPQQRSLLPRSSEGRWKWVRLNLKNKQGLNFWREGLGSALDQPSQFEWMQQPETTSQFSAVLGSPVKTSWTPFIQGSFFADWNMPTYAIDIRQDEFYEALPGLQRMGLRAAAVTAPLKLLMFEMISRQGGELSVLAKELASVNTVWFADQVLYGHNTDLQGFTALLAQAPEATQIAVWGGGGTSAMIEKVLPSASYYRSTTGDLKKGAALQQIEMLIWAAPRGNKMQFPPKQWKPQVVVDMNYLEGSGGREYAQLVGCRYISGAKMFLEQAKGQREFWLKFLEKA